MKPLLLRLILILINLYTLLIGSTFNGILQPNIRLISMCGLIVLAAIWLFTRARNRWTWHRTPLDAAIPLWIVAFTISLIANTDEWRRIVMGLWYMGAYVVLWYALTDAIANCFLNRAALIDSLLIVGGLMWCIDRYS